MTDLPCMRDKCIAKDCGNFGERGCKGGVYPPWSYARRYLEEPPKKNIQGNLKAMEDNNENNNMDKT